MEIRLEQVTKKFGNQFAVKELSFSVQKNEILGFLGPNGAGKSTTMKMITGYIKPDEGDIYLDGNTIFKDPIEVKRNIGYLSETNPLYKDMYVKEYLGFVSKIHKLTNLPSRVANVIEQTGLGKESHKLISQLSKGYKQRVGIAQALIHEPKILILDEPTSGLDLNQLVDIRSLIKTLSKDKTIIFSTHIMQEVQALCSRVIIINNGTKLVDQPIELLAQTIEDYTEIELELLGDFNETSFKSITGVKHCKKSGNVLVLRFNKDKDLRPQIFDHCVANGLKILSMKGSSANIEQVFQNLTQKSA